MKKRLLLLAALICVALSLSGQDGGRFCASCFDMDATPIPASPTALFTTTFYAYEMTLTNTNTIDVACVLQDRQATPRALFSNVVKPGLYIFRFNGRKMTNGLTWSCADGTSVIGYIQGTK